MPRLSLYRPQKGSDFKFIDRTVYEMFQVGGVDVFIHKYIGPADPSDPNKAMGETTIQDVIFLENRDRKYEADVYTLRGVYNVQDTDFNLSQFGLFLQNDTVFLTVHINNSVDTIGRKIMSGDVVELPNLKDEYALNDFKNALKRFYVVEDVNRAAEGFSSTWYPHLYRLKLKPIMDSQEFKDILNRPEDEDNFAGDWSSAVFTGVISGTTLTVTSIGSGKIEVGSIIYGNNLQPVKIVSNGTGTGSTGTYNIAETRTFDLGVLTANKSYYPGEVVRYNGTLYVVKPEVGTAGTTLTPPDTTAWAEYVDTTVRDMMSTYEKEMQINNAILLEAEADANLSGSDTDHFFTLSVDPDTGNMAVNTVDTSLTVDTGLDVSEVMKPPVREGYNGYLIQDGIAPNSTGQFGFGIQFPRNPILNDTYLRTDYYPNRMFKWDGVRWIKQEDNVRMTLSNTDDRQTLKTSFINNSKQSGISVLKSDSIALGNTPPWTAGEGTVDVQIRNTGIFVLTDINFVEDLYIEVWVDEDSKAQHIEKINENGKLAFIITDTLLGDSRLRWIVYDVVVEQRQSLSKALRKIKPQAD